MDLKLFSMSGNVKEYVDIWDVLPDNLAFVLSHLRGENYSDDIKLYSTSSSPQNSSL